MFHGRDGKEVRTWLKEGMSSLPVTYNICPCYNSCLPSQQETPSAVTPPGVGVWSKRGGNLEPAAQMGGIPFGQSKLSLSQHALHEQRLLLIIIAIEPTSPHSRKCACARMRRRLRSLWNGRGIWMGFSESWEPLKQQSILWLCTLYYGWGPYFSLHRGHVFDVLVIKAKSMLRLGRAAMKEWGMIIKDKNGSSETEAKVIHIFAFPVTMEGCESWTGKRANRKKKKKKNLIHLEYGVEGELYPGPPKRWISGS